jgi:4-hydroxy-tetrahydrodipicolinate synthase
MSHSNGKPSSTRGVLSPVVTPFDSTLRPDGRRMINHCRWLLANDVGLAIFGTNSEANSLSIDEKLELLELLVDAGLPAQRIMPGTGCCALSDTVRLTTRATQLGCAGVLMLPPFYYKGVSDDGLFRSFAEVIERVGNDRLRIYLYHIPQVAQVGISLGLIERLLDHYPGIVAGIKDSSGDWNNTRAMLEAFQPAGFDVFAGSETFLLQTLRAGGAGCISATANVNPAAISRLARAWQSSEADALQSGLDAVRSAFQHHPMIPALKTAIATYGDDPEWARVRPPLVELGCARRAALLASLDELGFTMPGLATAHEELHS